VGEYLSRSRTAVSFWLVVGLAFAHFAAVDAVAGAEPTLCVNDGPYAGGVVVELCLEAPDSGSTVSGVIDIGATLRNVGEPTVPLSAFGARRVVFTLDGGPLLTDYSAPYTFGLPTDHFADGTYTLELHAVMRDSFTDEPNHETPVVSIQLDFANGNASQPTNTNHYEPTSGRAAGPGEAFILAATGDAASGEPIANGVSDMIDSWDPNLFLYLGDVYEDGTYTEFVNWYGTTDSLWGRFKDVTNPTLGNHEYAGTDAPGYFYYWDNVPRFYSFDAHGWHFVTIDSNSRFGGTDPGTEQFEWLRQELTTSDAACTVVFLHHPVWSIGTQGSTERLEAVWDLMVGTGVDIVLAGHDHNYQRWQPLDAAGAPHPAGPTHFVAGAGGHGVRPFGSSDARVVYGADTYQNPDTRGALRFALDADRAVFEYVTVEGLTLDSGAVDCIDPQYSPGSFRNRISIERAALAGLLVDGEPDKIAKAVEHLDKALDDDRWESDERPAINDGHKVVESLKKAVHELEDAPPNEASAGAIIRLTNLGREMAASALAEARDVLGDLDEISKAQDKLESGVEEQAKPKYEEALDDFRSSFEHARKALEGAPDPWTDGEGIRGMIGSVLSSAWALVPTSDGGDDGKIEDAVDQLTKALDVASWDDEVRPADDSDAKVPDAIKHAIDKLEDVEETDVHRLIVELLTVSHDLASNAIAEAVARGGDEKDIAEALEKMADAELEIADLKYKDAADRFKQAFEKARDA
jgi:tetratricopeptide (TPR) repeat protein